MDVEKQKILLDAFEQFPDYHFLWKFEEPTIDLKLPKNVIIRPWLPQSDILAHPNIKAFFSHSGLLPLNLYSFLTITSNNHHLLSIHRNAQHTGSDMEGCSNSWHALCIRSKCSKYFFVKSNVKIGNFLKMFSLYFGKFYFRICLNRSNWASLKVWNFAR